MLDGRGLVFCFSGMHRVWKLIGGTIMYMMTLMLCDRYAKLFSCGKELRTFRLLSDFYVFVELSLSQNT